MDQRHLLRMLALARVAIGAGLMVAPNLLPKAFGDAPSATGRMTTRMAGARDLALGLATLRALERDEAPMTWAAVTAACDASDALVTALAGTDRGVRRVPALLGAVSAASAALAARRTLRSLA